MTQDPRAVEALFAVSNGQVPGPAGGPPEPLGLYGYSDDGYILSIGPVDEVEQLAVLVTDDLRAAGEYDFGHAVAVAAALRNAAQERSGLLTGALVLEFYDPNTAAELLLRTVVGLTVQRPVSGRSTLIGHRAGARIVSTAIGFDGASEYVQRALLVDHLPGGAAATVENGVAVQRLHDPNGKKRFLRPASPLWRPGPDDFEVAVATIVGP